jgi:hypothetical protein
MAQVRRRTVATEEDAPVRRRRDRAAAEDEATEPEDDDTEAVRPRKKAAASTTTVKRRREAEPEEDDAEPEPAEDDWDADDGDDADAEPEPRPRKAAATKKAARRAPEPEPDDDGDEEPVRARRSSKGKGELPLGVKKGIAGIDEVQKSGGSGIVRLTLSEEPELIKILAGAEDVFTFRQHWVPQGGGGGDRPYTCIGKAKGCPLCELGDYAGQVIVLNVLHLSNPEEPDIKILQLGIKAWKSLEGVAKSKKTGKVDIEKGYYTVTKTGKKQQTQTNFRPINEDDIEDDWEELLDNFDLDDLPALIEDAKQDLFTEVDVVQTSTKTQLREVASYLAED